MAENETKPTGTSIEEYIASRANERQRADCQDLMACGSAMGSAAAPGWREMDRTPRDAPLSAGSVR